MRLVAQAGLQHEPGKQDRFGTAICPAGFGVVAVMIIVRATVIRATCAVGRYGALGWTRFVLATCRLVRLNPLQITEDDADARAQPVVECNFWRDVMRS